VGRARRSVAAHCTTRFVIALTDAGAEAERARRACDLRGRTRDIVHAQTLRWLVEGFVQDWQTFAGWGTWPQQPGEAGARRSRTGACGWSLGASFLRPNTPRSDPTCLRLP
jgi:hypothetical protein